MKTKKQDLLISGSIHKIKNTLSSLLHKISNLFIGDGIQTLMYPKERKKTFQNSTSSQGTPLSDLKKVENDIIKVLNIMPQSISTVGSDTSEQWFISFNSTEPLRKETTHNVHYIGSHQVRIDYKKHQLTRIHDRV